MSVRLCLFITIFLARARAQQPGTNTLEIHPALLTQQCTLSDGCITVNTSIVLDANYRWLHEVGGYTNCISGGSFDPMVCPDVQTCALSCALEGTLYPSRGITTSSSSLTLSLFTNKSNITTLASPRAYLMENETTYSIFQLLNQEFTFDVDVSDVPCGVNAALYFVEMGKDGDMNGLNRAGARFGTGYCDAQCPAENFIQGVANLNHTLGACCAELDIWEANSLATFLSAHPCNISSGLYTCNGIDCGTGARAAKYFGICDEDGCDYNPYRLGAPSFYGPGLTVDTTRPFTVVTQFLTDDNTSTGTLIEIRRFYLQDGVIIQNSPISIPGIPPGNSITDDFCTSQKAKFNAVNAFSDRGGLASIGEALARGMVLVFSIWEDAKSEMAWLDSTLPPGSTDLGAVRGPCGIGEGATERILMDHPDSKVVFSDIRSGDLGSTFLGAAVAAGGGIAAGNVTLVRGRVRGTGLVVLGEMMFGEGDGLLWVGMMIWL